MSLLFFIQFNYVQVEFLFSMMRFGLHVYVFFCKIHLADLINLIIFRSYGVFFVRIELEKRSIEFLCWILVLSVLCENWVNFMNYA